MKTLIIFLIAAILVGPMVEAETAPKPPVKKILKAKKAHRVVKRSANYRKTKADIDNAVDEALRGGGDQDSSYSEPSLDISEVEIVP